MMNRVTIILFLVSGLIGQVATEFRFPKEGSFLETLTVAETTRVGLTSNVISEIRLQGDTSWVWLGTTRGLSRIKDSLHVESFFTIANTELTNDSATGGYFPEGGVSAIAVKGDTVFVAFSKSVNDFSTGQGVVYSTNTGAEFPVWQYYKQPVDDENAEIFPFGGIGFVRGLPITVPQYNLTYDATIGAGYIWIASWAGGLRRYKLSDGSWERIPIPQDDQMTLATCADSSYEIIDGQNILKNYSLNPRDPIDGGNHNHKAFSVLVYGDTVWVGTANGINRGIVGSQGCIDWEHYAYPFENLSGNFVVSIARQTWNGQRIIWAATLNAEGQTEKRGVSYTRNDGGTWSTALIGERAYNIYAQDSLVFAATANGLWKSEDGQNWAKYNQARNLTPLDGDETLSDKIYAVVLDERNYYSSTVLWIGTGDGLARSDDLAGSNWQIYRADFDPEIIYAYPNPFSPNLHNVFEGQGYVRFHLGEFIANEVQMAIYNFAMEPVYENVYNRQDPNTGSIKWDGKDGNGRLVSNGVYFVKLNYAQDNTATPTDHWIKLIVIK